jgi:hypothetical protein
VAENDGTGAPIAGRPRAVRLTIAYRGEQLELISQQSVAMKTPPSDPVESFAERTGFWVDLKDERDQTLYRRVMHDPIRQDVEVFSPGPEQTIQRAPVADPQGVFSVVLPEIEAAQAVSLIGSPPRTAGPALGVEAERTEPARAREIARFELKPRH